MEPISVKWKNNTVNDIKEQHASQGKPKIKLESNDSEGRSNLSVTGISEAEDSYKNCDSEISQGKILQETTEIDDNTKVRTSTTQCKLSSHKNYDFLWKF
jgi:hypothetical protein